MRRVPCDSWEPHLWVREAPFLCSCFPTASSNPAAKLQDVPQVTLRSEDVLEGPSGCRSSGNTFWRAFEARGAGPRGKGPWHRHAELKKKEICNLFSCFLPSFLTFLELTHKPAALHFCCAAGGPGSRGAGRSWLCTGALASKCCAPCRIDPRDPCVCRRVCFYFFLPRDS